MSLNAFIHQLSLCRYKCLSFACATCISKGVFFHRLIDLLFEYHLVKRPQCQLKYFLSVLYNWYVVANTYLQNIDQLYSAH